MGAGALIVVPALAAPHGHTAALVPGNHVAARHSVSGRTKPLSVCLVPPMCSADIGEPVNCLNMVKPAAPPVAAQVVQLKTFADGPNKVLVHSSVNELVAVALRSNLAVSGAVQMTKELNASFVGTCAHSEDALHSARRLSSRFHS